MLSMVSRIALLVTRQVISITKNVLGLRINTFYNNCRFNKSRRPSLNTAYKSYLEFEDLKL